MSHDVNICIYPIYLVAHGVLYTNDEQCKFVGMGLQVVQNELHNQLNKDAKPTQPSINALSMVWKSRMC